MLSLLILTCFLVVASSFARCSPFPTCRIMHLVAAKESLMPPPPEKSAIRCLKKQYMSLKSVRVDVNSVNANMAAYMAATGVFGFITKGSKPALAMGLAMGGLYAYASKLITDPCKVKLGHGLATITSAALAGRMADYVITSRQFLPRGITAGAALAAGVYNAKKFVAARRDDVRGDAIPSTTA